MQDGQLILDQLEEGLLQIFNELDKGLTISRYSQLYSLVHSYCTKYEHEMSLAKIKDSLMSGSSLYLKLENFVKNHCKKCLDLISMEENIIHSLERCWTEFKLSTKVVHNLFAYLDRFWLKALDGSASSTFGSVRNLCLKTFKAELYDKLHDRLMNEFPAELIKEREGQTIEREKLIIIIDCILSIDPTGKFLYSEGVEKYCVQSMTKYYQSKVSHILENESILFYSQYAFEKSITEHDLCKSVFQEGTKLEYMEKYFHVAVKEKERTLADEFHRFMKNDEWCHCHNFYHLLSNIENGLDSSTKVFSDVVNEQGKASISKISDDQTNIDCKEFVLAVQELYSKINEIVKTQFNQDPKFIKAMEKGIKQSLNNGLTKKSHAAELLAKYLDALLRKGSKHSVDVSTESLEPVFIVFKFLEDKDIFQKFYSKTVARRLVNGSSVSDDLETEVVERLRTLCGFDYTHKLTKMYQDIEVSKEVNEGFTLESDFSAMVLSQGAWPLSCPTFELKFDALTTLFDKFQQYYTSKHSGRKLQLLASMTKVELKAEFGGKTYTFLCNAYQAAILEAFNSHSTLTLTRLQEMTGISLPVLTGNLEIMQKAKLINGSYSVNADFQSKKVRVNLNLPIKSQVEVEAKATVKAVEGDRHLIVQAAIVRIMKTKNRMLHVELVSEVVRQLSNQFKPSISQIKKCIDILVDKEYIERGEDMNEIKYVA